MPAGAVDVVGDEGTARADVIGSRRQHEVVDRKLAAAAEEIAQGTGAVGALKDIGLLNPDPGQAAAFGTQVVKGVGQFLFAGKQRLAGIEPCLARNNELAVGGAIVHRDISFVAVSGADLREERLPISSAVRPVRPPVPAAISAAVVRQRGHMRGLRLGCGGRLSCRPPRG